ncbi:MAG: SprT family zinc-dependent metalloprotease [Oscillospiraceae bacterium]|nr:SprT family zinc-dependent metalloprotease [Oscillospiraceae bacterium]
MSATSKRMVLAEGQEISYVLERKQVKNLNLRIKKDGSVFVSANDAVPYEEVDQFVFNKASYILGAVKRFNEMALYKPQPKQYVSGETFYLQGRGLRLLVSQATQDSISSDGVYIYLKVKDVNDFEKKRRMVNRFLDCQCKTIFGEVMDELYPLFKKYGIEKPTLRIRDMETRWGSCLAKKGIVTLNKQLLEAPRNCIEYVVMHELCHFMHPNHSKCFYAFLSMLMPDWKERKQFLDKTATFWL